MRLRLLVLLIITQCYSVYTEADINSLEGTVYDSPNLGTSRKADGISQTDRWRSKDGARFTRDTDEFTLTAQDDLSNLSIEDLKSKLNQAELHKNATTVNETRIQGEFDSAKSASQTANNTLETAEREWNDALKEKNRLEEPLQEVKKEIDAKKMKLDDMKEVLSTAAAILPFPPTALDREKYALNASNFAQQSLEAMRSRMKQLEMEIPRLVNEKRDIGNQREYLNGQIKLYLEELERVGCPEPSFVKKSETAKTRRKRKEDCEETLMTANALNANLTKTNEPLVKAEALLAAARKELHEKQVAEPITIAEKKTWQDYIAAVANVTLADNELKEARNKQSESKELIAAKFKENKLHGSLNRAKEAAPPLAAEYTRLKAQLATAKEKASEAVGIYNHYQNKYKEKSSMPVEEAGLPWEIIGGAVLFVIIVVVVGVLLYIFWWKKRRGGQETDAVEESEDGSKEGGKGGKKEKVKADKKGGGKGEKKEKTKSDKTKSDQNEVQKSDEKKDEKEKSKPELPEKSKPDDQGDKVVADMKALNENQSTQRRIFLKDDHYEGHLALNENQPKHRRILKNDAYKGDLPPYKADEVITKTSRGHEFDNGEFHNGLKANEQRETGEKVPAGEQNTVDLKKKDNDKDATMNTRLEWEQPANYPAKSKAKMDAAELHRQLAHCLGSMKFHRIADLTSRNKDYRVSSIDIDVNGKIGYRIIGSSDSIKTEEETKETFRKLHSNVESFLDGIIYR